MLTTKINTVRSNMLTEFRYTKLAIIIFSIPKGVTF